METSLSNRYHHSQTCAPLRIRSRLCRCSWENRPRCSMAHWRHFSIAPNSLNSLPGPSHPSGAFFADDSLLADDDSNDVTIESDQGRIRTKTTWTLLLYLTSEAEGCQGGETVFFPFDRRVAKEEVAVAPETGMLLLHKHGKDCMLVSYINSFFSLVRPGSPGRVHVPSVRTLAC